MRYGNRSLGRRIISSPFTLVAAFILFIILAKATWNIHQKVNLSEVRLSQARAELGRLQSHQSELEKQISYLKSEQGIETEMRTKFRAIKEGESVAVIVDDSQAQLAATASSGVDSAGKTGWFKKILQFLGI